MKTINKMLLGCCLLTPNPNLYGSQCNAISSGNHSPFAAIHLQPATITPASCHNSIRVRYSVSNNFVLRDNDNEDLLIDGELAQLSLSGQLALNKNWADFISVTLPIHQHSGGSLDGLIDNWHELTGLPAGDRDQRANNQLAYQYQRDGESLVDITEQQRGLGDITVALHKNHYSVAIKLPTGDETKLTGSGGLEVGLSSSKPLPEAGFSGVAYTLGASYLADDQVIPQHYRDFTASGTLAAAYAIGNHSNLFISGSWQSAWYKSDIGALGSASGTIGLGVYSETKDGFWSLRITEDFPTETAPDFGLSVDYSFKL